MCCAEWILERRLDGNYAEEQGSPAILHEGAGGRRLEGKGLMIGACIILEGRTLFSKQGAGLVLPIQGTGFVIFPWNVFVRT